MARKVRTTAERGAREHDVDALGLGNKVLSTAFTLAPGMFDRFVGPLMRALSTPTARRPGLDSGQRADRGPR